MKKNRMNSDRGFGIEHVEQATELLMVAAVGILLAYIILEALTS
jgi:hypothetical protein